MQPMTEKLLLDLMKVQKENMDSIGLMLDALVKRVEMLERGERRAKVLPPSGDEEFNIIRTLSGAEEGFGVDNIGG